MYEGMSGCFRLFQEVRKELPEASVGFTGVEVEVSFITVSGGFPSLFEESQRGLRGLTGFPKLSDKLQVSFKGGR